MPTAWAMRMLAGGTCVKKEPSEAIWNAIGAMIPRMELIIGDSVIIYSCTGFIAATRSAFRASSELGVGYN
jgi:hypothetical protein